MKYHSFNVPLFTCTRLIYSFLVAASENENVICHTGGVNCICKTGFFSPSGDPTTNKDCEEIETCGENHSDWCGRDAICDDSTNVVVCSCKAGFFSPTEDPKKHKDCISRISQAEIGLEFKAGSDFSWDEELGKFKYKDQTEWSIIDKNKVKLPLIIS